MAEQTPYHFLPQDPCLTEQQLFGYIDGKLNAAEMFAVEKHLLDCPFCSDALEGLQRVKEREKITAFVPPVQTSSPAKEETEKKEPKVIPLFRSPRFVFAAAASVAVILVVTLVMKMSLSAPENAKVADVSEKSGEQKATVSVAPKKDSIAPGYSGDKFKNAEIQSVPQEENQRALADNRNTNGPGQTRDANYWHQTISGETTENDAMTPVDDQPMVAKQLDEVSSDMSAPQQETERVDQDNVAIQQQGTFSNTTNEESKNDGTKKENLFIRSKSSNQKSAAPASGGAVGGIATGSAPQPNVAEKSQQTQQGRAESVDVNSSVGDTTSLEGYKTEDVPAAGKDKSADTAYETGMKLLADGKTQQAIVQFDEVLKNPSNAHYADAQWQKSQALIKLNKKEEAKKLLNEIVKSGGKYKTQAEEALKKL